MYCVSLCWRVFITMTQKIIFRFGEVNVLVLNGKKILSILIKKPIFFFLLVYEQEYITFSDDKHLKFPAKYLIFSFLFVFITYFWLDKDMLSYMYSRTPRSVSAHISVSSWKIFLSVEWMEVLIMNIIRQRDSIKSYMNSLFSFFFSSGTKVGSLQCPFTHRIYCNINEKLLTRPTYYIYRLNTSELRNGFIHLNKPNIEDFRLWSGFMLYVTVICKFYICFSGTMTLWEFFMAYTWDY